MKDKPLAIIITLIGGAAACLCCIFKQAGLLPTLVTVLITLLVFLIIGLIVNSVYVKIRTEVAEAERLEAERLAKEKEELEAKEAGVNSSAVEKAVEAVRSAESGEGSHTDLDEQS